MCAAELSTADPSAGLRAPQAVFNEEVWKPSSNDYKRSGVSLRIMNIYDFVNSKTLFRTMR